MVTPAASTRHPGRCRKRGKTASNDAGLEEAVHVGRIRHAPGYSLWVVHQLDGQSAALENDNADAIHDGRLQRRFRRLHLREILQQDAAVVAHDERARS